MKLNLHILYDEIKEFGYKLLANDDISLDLKGVRFFPESGDLCLPEYLYLAHAQDLYQNTNINSARTFLCIGEIDEEFFRQKGWNAIYINQEINEREVFEYILSIFEKYETWEQGLTGSILQKTPIQESFEIGAEILWNPIILSDMSLTVVMKAGQIPENIKGSAWEEIINVGYAKPHILTQEERDTLFANLQHSRKPFFLKSSYYPAFQNVMISLFHYDVPISYFHMIDIIKPITLGQLSLLSHLRDLMELALKNSDEFAQLNEPTNFFVGRILQGFAIEPQVVSFHLSKRDWVLEDDYCIYSFFHPRNEALDQGQSHYYRSVLTKIFNDSMIFPYENGVVAIVRGSDRAKLYRHSLATTLEKIGLQAGVSLTFTNFLNLKYAYIQSKAALKEGVLRMPDGYVFDFEACYCDHIVHSLDQVTSLKSLCNPKLLHLAEKGEEKELEFIRSLRLYLLNGLNTSATSAKLFIHRNTLMYRLERMEKLLELDLDDLNEQQFLSLYLTCLIIDYL